MKYHEYISMISIIIINLLIFGFIFSIYFSILLCIIIIITNTVKEKEYLHSRGKFCHNM